jgi:hypothetical protein
MKPSTYFTAAGILGVAFGLVFALFAEQALPLYGLPVTPGMVLEGRYFGSALLGLGALGYVMRDAHDAVLVRKALLAVMLGAAVGAVVSVIGMLTHVLGPLGWSSAAIYVLLIAFGAASLKSAN